MLGFEKCSPLLLSRSHFAATAKLRLSHPVDKMRRTDKQIQIEGPVLTMLKCSKTVQNQWLFGTLPGAELFVEEQAVTAKTFRLVL